jgi:outer membrane protein TolC
MRQITLGGNPVSKRLFLVLMMLFIPALGSATEPPSQTKILTLEQAVSLALESNRSVKNSELEVSKQEDSLAIARTKRLPTFDATLFGSMLLKKVDYTFKQGDFGTFPSGEPNPSSDVRVTTPRKFNVFALVSVNQPLTQLFRVNLGIQSAKINFQLANEDLRSRRQSIANEVKAAYYAVLQSQSALEALEQSIKLYHELDRVTGDYVLQQVALKSQGLEVRGQLAKAEYDSLKLRNTIRSQKERLNQLLGQPISTEFLVSPIPEAKPFEMDLAAAQSKAREQRPELQSAKLKQKQAELDRRSKKSEFIPDLSLSYRYVSPFNLDPLPRNISSAGLYMSWEPFDWGRRRRELATKRKVEQQARLNVEETETQVLLEVNTKFRKLEETRAAFYVSQLSQETEREKLRVLSNRYTEKAALLSDVLQTQAELAQANHQYRDALATFWTAKAEFEKALGEEQ